MQKALLVGRAGDIEDMRKFLIESGMDPKDIVEVALANR